MHLAFIKLLISGILFVLLLPYALLKTRNFSFIADQLTDCITQGVDVYNIGADYKMIYDLQQQLR